MNEYLVRLERLQKYLINKDFESIEDNVTQFGSSIGLLQYKTYNFMLEETRDIISDFYYNKGFEIEKKQDGFIAFNGKDEFQVNLFYDQKESLLDVLVMLNENKIGECPEASEISYEKDLSPEATKQNA